MATWTFEDGSKLLSGGIVEGFGAAALELTIFFRHEPVVQMAPEPMDPVPVDPSSNYLLDEVARVIARRVRQRVSTDYVQRDEDVPANVTAQREAAMRAERDSYGRAVY